MKKILYIWKDKYPWDVRVEKFCRTLTKSGFDVLLLARWKGEVKREEEIDGFFVKRACYNQRPLLSQPLSINYYWRKEIKNAIDGFKPDIIITREFFLTSAAKSFAKDIPVIMDMAEHYPAAMKGWDKYNSNLLLKTAVHNLEIPAILEKDAIKHSDAIITISQELENRLLNNFNVSPDNCIQVLNTPELSMFSTVDKGINNPVTRFAYHGHFSNDRNLVKLVTAFIEAVKINNDVTLFMAGTGENFEYISNLIHKARCENKITLYGEYKMSDYNTFLSCMDIGILPYKTNEFINHIISNKLFDYMACGKPVIVSNAEPMKRILSETQSGIVVDCEKADNITEAVINMANSYPVQLSKNGIHWAESKYNWEIDSNKLINFINKFI